MWVILKETLAMPDISIIEAIRKTCWYKQRLKNCYCLIGIVYQWFITCEGILHVYNTCLGNW